jgi:hypothetical protein
LLQGLLLVRTVLWLKRMTSAIPSPWTLRCGFRPSKASECFKRICTSKVCIPSTHTYFVRFKTVVNRSVDKMQPRVSAPTANIWSLQEPQNLKGRSLEKWTQGRQSNSHGFWFHDG